MGTEGWDGSWQTAFGLRQARTVPGSASERNVRRVAVQILIYIGIFAAVVGLAPHLVLRPGDRIVGQIRQSG